MQKLQKEVDRLEGKSHWFVTDLLQLIETVGTYLQVFA